jgi:hypothetical protein
MSGDPASPCSGQQTIRYTQDQILERQHRNSRPSIPTFYPCGIMAARVGYYQLAELLGGDRILLYGLNLEDMQRRQHPVAGTHLAHPESLFAVGVYKPGTPGEMILADLMKHQAAFKQVIAEEGTLVRTGANVFQSRSVSYAMRDAPVKPGEGRLVHIDAYVAVLPGQDYVPVYEGTGLKSERLRFPRTRLTAKGPIPACDAIFEILSHFSELQTNIANGEDLAVKSIARRGTASRLLGRLQIGAVRRLSQLEDSARSMATSTRDSLEHMDAGTVISAWRMFKSVQDVTEKTALTILGALQDNFEDGGIALLSGAHTVRRSLPESLAPYVRQKRVDTPLTLFLTQLDPTRFDESMVSETILRDPEMNMTPARQKDAQTRSRRIPYPKPLTLAESRMCPAEIQVRDIDPFDSSKHTHVGWNSVRHPLGTIVLAYENTLLQVQGNGLWMSARHDLGKTYVGFNERMDKATSARPSPHVAEWLQPGHVICFTHNAEHHRRDVATLIPLEKAMKDLGEIVRGGDGYLLTAEKPRLTPLPLIIPARAREVNMNFDGALKGTAAIRAQNNADVVPAEGFSSP